MSSKVLKQRIFTIKEAWNQEIQYIQDRHTGIIQSYDTGYPKWNSVYLNGWENGYIVIYSGMSGVGKTTFMNKMNNNIRKFNPKERFSELNFNYEMPARKLVGKTISARLGLSTKQLYSATGHSNLDIQETTINQLLDNERAFTKYDINFVEYPGTVEDMSDTIDYFAETRQISPTLDGRTLIVTLDHPQLIRKIGGGGERDTLMELASMLNEKKKKYPKSIYFIISQMNRDIEDISRMSRHGGNKIHNFPKKSDTYGSDALFNISDSFVCLHRPEMLGLSQYGPYDWETKGFMFTHHLKTRDGVPKITLFRNELETNNLVEVSLLTH